MDHVYRVSPHPLREDEQLPVAEVPAQYEDPRAPLPRDRLPPPCLVLETDHLAQPLRRQTREVRQLGRHASEVQERPPQDAPALADGLFRKCEREIHLPDPAMRAV